MEGNKTWKIPTFIFCSFIFLFLQGNMWGHDSYEDARASMELMLWKVRKDINKTNHDIIMHQTDHRRI